MKKNVKKFLVTALSGILLSSFAMGVAAPIVNDPSKDIWETVFAAAAVK